MCGVAAVAIGASSALGIGGELMQYAAQKDAAKANRAEALHAYEQNIAALNLRETQQGQATTQSILQADRQARAADALARVSAGESGVAGASVTALLDDITRQANVHDVNARRNLDATTAQLEAEKRGAQATMQSRIAAQPMPSAWATGLQILGTGIDAASNIYIRSHPQPKGKGQ